MIENIQQQLKQQFPQVCAKVTETSGEAWFAGLAQAVNADMAQGVDAGKHRQLLMSLKSHYFYGNEEVKGCLDTAFAGNLFWQIQPEQAQPYWQVLPKVFQELYVRDHGVLPV